MARRAAADAAVAATVEAAVKETMPNTFVGLFVASSVVWTEKHVAFQTQQSCSSHVRIWSLQFHLLLVIAFLAHAAWMQPRLLCLAVPMDPGVAILESPVFRGCGSIAKKL